jgi:hypothetical protein
MTTTTTRDVLMFLRMVDCEIPGYCVLGLVDGAVMEGNFVIWQGFLEPSRHGHDFAMCKAIIRAFFGDENPDGHRLGPRLIPEQREVLENLDIPPLPVEVPDFEGG